MWVWPLTLLPGQMGYGAWTPRVGAVDRGGAPGKNQDEETNPQCALSTHSWVGKSPGARAALLWALAAALQRRESTLVSRLERHGVELKVAKAEVELSVRRLRAWGARVQAPGCTLQVRGVCGPADRAGSLEWRQRGSRMSQTRGPGPSGLTSLHLAFILCIMGIQPTSE